MSDEAHRRGHAVFVYGTLLRGERNHRLLDGARFMGEASTEPGFELADLGAFPAMLPGSGAGGVVGELYGVDTQTLAALDRLERHPHFYRRTPIALANGACADAYLLDPALAQGRPRIASGDWRHRQATRRRRC